VGYRGGFPVKAGEPGAGDFLTRAFDAAPKRKRTRAVQPNVGTQALYRKKLQKLTKCMADSVTYWLKAGYRANPPKMAQDALPSKDLERVIKALRRRWERQFDQAAPKLAAWFLQSVSSRSQAQLMKILRDAGISVKFQMTAEMKDVLAAVVQENVSLIRSIPSQYFTQIETLVAQSVTRGRDLGFLTKELQARYGVSYRRAALIARDQNNKATSALMKVRQTTLGIKEGIWMHSHAGKEPRPTHVANNNKKFSIEKGWYDPDRRVRRYIMPGELINCRCTWRPVVEGFS
jgi:SPP1 gp7 family putative phage head morphogenesis protein